MAKTSKNLDEMLDTLQAVATTPDAVTVGEFASAVLRIQREMDMLSHAVKRFTHSVSETCEKELFALEDAPAEAKTPGRHVVTPALGPRPKLGEQSVEHAGQDGA